jgi:hypothetical protein
MGCSEWEVGAAGAWLGTQALSATLCISRIAEQHKVLSDI